MVNSLRPYQGIRGYKLNAGDIIKLGRAKFLVKEFKVDQMLVGVGSNSSLENSKNTDIGIIQKKFKQNCAYEEGDDNLHL